MNQKSKIPVAVKAANVKTTIRAMSVVLLAFSLQEPESTIQTATILTQFSEVDHV